MQAVQFTVSISLEYSSMPQLSTVKIKTLKKKGEFDQFGFVTRSSSLTNLVSITTPSIMAKLTVCKCGRPGIWCARGAAELVWIQSPISLLHYPPVSSKSGKRVRVRKNRAPPLPTSKKSMSKAKDLPEAKDAEYIEDSEPESVRDISGQTYSLHKSVMLGDTVIVGDTDFLKHEKFDYRQFETYNIRKLNDAAEKGKFSFDYVSGTATIMAKGVRICDNITITVEDNHGWKKVEKGIERYMLTNKKDIIIKLAVVYAKTSESDSNSSDDEKPSTKKVFTFVCC